MTKSVCNFGRDSTRPPGPAPDSHRTEDPRPQRPSAGRRRFLERDSRPRQAAPMKLQHYTSRPWRRSSSSSSRPPRSSSRPCSAARRPRVHPRHRRHDWIGIGKHQPVLTVPPSPRGAPPRTGARSAAPRPGAPARPRAGLLRPQCSTTSRRAPPPGRQPLRDLRTQPDGVVVVNIRLLAERLVENPGPLFRVGDLDDEARRWVRSLDRHPRLDWEPHPGCSGDLASPDRRRGQHGAGQHGGDHPRRCARGVPSLTGTCHDGCVPRRPQLCLPPHGHRG